MARHKRAFAALTVAGRVRRHNEDAVLCSPELGLWAVADGMGGAQRGEVASALALETLQRAIANGQGLRTAMHAANLAVFEYAEANNLEMGTTLVCVRIHDDSEYELAWAGDSRAYCIDAHGIRQLSHDHSWVQTMVDAGELTVDEARRDPRRNIVLRCIGQTLEGFDIGYSRAPLEPNERMLLCSDGLSGELDDTELFRLCNDDADPTTTVNRLVQGANDCGGRDNISCIVIGRNVTAVMTIESAMRRFIRRLISPKKPRQPYTP
ncbi:PP2C family protein-serine/threonine phosphatase [Pseudomonas matsuisoli]|uniref:PP2C family protein-serine/threonine phosphatase n=1 Tax=Pseudomonas matsuisoli TaxID=1515666 RepID=UPI001E584575|nr:protein phosphatase 2C domain-containing protein [Pseudomonas matsuisoli]